MQNKKLLIVSPTFFPIMGGVERGIYEIYRHLLDDYEIHIVSPQFARTGDFWPQGIRPVGFHIHQYQDRVNLLRVRGQRLLFGVLPPFSVSMAAAVRELAGKIKPDLANVHFAIPSGLAIHALSQLGIPTALSLIGRDIPGPDTLPFWQTYVRWAIRKSKLTIFISRYSERALLADSKDTFVRTIIPYGTNVPSYDENHAADLRLYLGIPKDFKVVFCLQRLEKVKRVDVILTAFQMVLQRRRDIMLVVGGTGKELNRLKQFAVQLGIDQNVKFTGFIDEGQLYNHYRMADMFVFHSTFETFGVAVVEAMAARIPIVAADNTAVPELIKHIETGWLVPPLQPELLAEGILTLLDDPALASNLSEQAFRKVSQDYTWERTANAYRKALASIHK